MIKSHISEVSEAVMCRLIQEQSESKKVCPASKDAVVYWNFKILKRIESEVKMYRRATQMDYEQGHRHRVARMQMHDSMLQPIFNRIAEC